MKLVESNNKGKGMTAINESTLERAFAIAKVDGIEVNESNCLDFFKKALESEINQVVRIIDENGHQFGAGRKFVEGMCKRVYLTLSE